MRCNGGQCFYLVVVRLFGCGSGRLMHGRGALFRTSSFRYLSSGSCNGNRRPGCSKHSRSTSQGDGYGVCRGNCPGDRQAFTGRLRDGGCRLSHPICRDLGSTRGGDGNRSGICSKDIRDDRSRVVRGCSRLLRHSSFCYLSIGIRDGVRRFRSSESFRYSAGRFVRGCSGICHHFVVVRRRRNGPSRVVRGCGWLCRQASLDCLSSGNRGGGGGHSYGPARKFTCCAGRIMPRNGSRRIAVYFRFRNILAFEGHTVWRRIASGTRRQRI